MLIFLNFHMLYILFYKQTIFRSHFSAITDTDIKKAMNNLGVPNENEALSVDARQELDLRIGCAFTRYQTKYFQVCYMYSSSSYFLTYFLLRNIKLLFLLFIIIAVQLQKSFESQLHFLRFLFVCALCFLMFFKLANSILQKEILYCLQQQPIMKYIWDSHSPFVHFAMSDMGLVQSLPRSLSHIQDTLNLIIQW